MTPDQIEARRTAALEAVALRRRARAAEARAAPELLSRAAPRAFSAEGARRLLEAPRFRARLGARLARMAGAGPAPWSASPGAIAILEMDAARVDRLSRDAGAALEAAAVLSLLKAEEQKRLAAALEGRDPAPAARRYGLEDPADGADFAWSDPDDPPERPTPEAIAEAVRLSGLQAFAAWLDSQPKAVSARVGLLAPEAAQAAPSEDPDLARRGARLVERIAAEAFGETRAAR